MMPFEGNTTVSTTAPFRVRLPATSANLGPGFDAAGLAFSLYLDVSAEIAAQDRIEATGRDVAIVSTVPDNLILMTYREVLGSLGLPAPSLHLRLDNGIPLGMGCGSSAAALCAGVLLANYFGRLRWTAEQILDEAARREGHPDNVAACLRGGFTVSRTVPADEGRTSHTLTATFNGEALPVRLLLALPTASLATREARALLPATYPRADAVLNVQNTALLVSAFAQGRPDLLRFATEDRLHEPYRLPACPLLRCLQPLRAHPEVFAVTLSGAGPSVLLMTSQAFSPEQITAAGGDFLADLLEVSIAPVRSAQAGK